MSDIPEPRRLGLWQLIREDWRTNGSWTRPGFQALAVHRLGVWRHRLPRVVQVPVGVVYYALNLFIRNVYGIEIASTTRIGRRLTIGHQGGTVIHYRAVIGDDCVIRQNVTIGMTSGVYGVPRLGNRVDVGAGAALIGDITIGDNVRIAPNTLVICDIPSGATVFPAPARILFPSEIRSDRPSNAVLPPPLHPADQPIAADADTEESPASTRLPESPRELVQFLQTTLKLDDIIDEETPMLSSGLIDSLKVIQLLAALESHYGAAISSEQVDAETFDTPNQMFQLLQSQLPHSEPS